MRAAPAGLGNINFFDFLVRLVQRFPWFRENVFVWCKDLCGFAIHDFRPEYFICGSHPARFFLVAKTYLFLGESTLYEKFLACRWYFWRLFSHVSANIASRILKTCSNKSICDRKNTVFCAFVLLFSTLSQNRCFFCSSRNFENIIVFYINPQTSMQF